MEHSTEGRSEFSAVCWDVVGCVWGTISVYFEITYVCFIPGRLPVFLWVASTNIYFLFIFGQKYHLKDKHKIYVVLKLEWGL